MPGPPRKRDAERRRRNKPLVETVKVNLDELIKREIEIPLPAEDWEPLTKSFYESFSRSGQAIWYEPSDWMAAYVMCETLDRHLKPQDVRVGERDVVEIDPEGDGESIQAGKDYIFEEKLIPIPASILTAILKGLTALMATEGDRRRLQVELERKAALDAALAGDGKVVSITQNRQELFK